ncbi:receptor-like cytosolic serine/threonine-protein kinase RBK2 isoform X2 [Impatiens glandulifera]|nr:receptor-like cytosolic serine/threonine-protein kinase RBK2 isoform X2 [Impatiens glandulifera]
MMQHNNGRNQLSSSISAHDLRCFEVEKEKENISSPRGVLEACIKGLDSDQFDDSSPADSSSENNEVQNPSSRKRWGGIFKLWKKGAMKRLSSFPAINGAVPKLSRGKSRRAAAAAEEEVVDTDCCILRCSWKTFSLSELKDATNDFNEENIIGKGGYADVYQGCLPDGQLVAVKRLSKGTAEEQTIALLSEIGTIAHVNHPNTAKLIGYCAEGGKYLVLRLSPLGSLGSLLRGSKEKLNWAVRYKIIKGTAAGLYYLHEHCQRRIIHRDIKADNILLTEDFEPQICDFGLAMWLPSEWTHHNVPKFEGTFGYFAPEYFMHGIVDEKTDVFSFGVLLLELITGREALDDSKKSLVLWAKPFLDNNEVEKLVDSSLDGIYDTEEMDRAIMLASLCIDQTPVIRPQMGQVLAMLQDKNGRLECTSENKRQFFQRTYSQELMDAEEYNSTRYLKDMNQHKRLVLGS